MPTVHTRRSTAATFAAALLLTGCATTSAKAPTATTPATASASTPTTAPTGTAATARATSATSTSHTTPSGPALTGFGATAADWETHHQPDSDFDPGSVYNADATLPQINGHTGAKYTTVSVLGGRVLNYQLNFHQGTTITAALTEVAAEFPADATVLWKQQASGCYQVEFQSPSIGKALATTGNPLGQVSVGLYNLDANAPYALLDNSPASTPAAASGC